MIELRFGKHTVIVMTAWVLFALPESTCADGRFEASSPAPVEVIPNPFIAVPSEEITQIDYKVEDKVIYSVTNRQELIDTHKTLTNTTFEAGHFMPMCGGKRVEAEFFVGPKRLEWKLRTVLEVNTLILYQGNFADSVVGLATNRVFVDRCRVLIDQSMGGNVKGRSGGVPLKHVEGQ